jgi:hypothetical protein
VSATNRIINNSQLRLNIRLSLLKKIIVENNTSKKNSMAIYDVGAYASKKGMRQSKRTRTDRIGNLFK